MSPDGNLPAARERLDKAITGLFDPITARINNHTHEAPSLYHQLCDSVGGQTGERSGGHAGLPLWPEALDLRNDIDTNLQLWCNGLGHDTYDRIHLLDVRNWRPQDTQLITTIATTIEAWATTITTLLNPEPRVTIPAPCPSCNTRTVYRHSAGEQIRQPALQVTKDGCHCMNHHCGATWTPDKYTFLAALLGFEKPAGLLE